MTHIALKASPNQLRLALSFLLRVLKPKVTSPFVWLWTLLSGQKKNNQYFGDSPNVDTPSLKPLKIWGRHLSNPSRFGTYCFDFILKKQNIQLLGWIKHRRFRTQEETPAALDGLEEPEKLWNGWDCFSCPIYFLFPLPNLLPPCHLPFPTLTFSCYTSGPSTLPILTPIPQSLPVGSSCSCSSQYSTGSLYTSPSHLPLNPVLWLWSASSWSRFAGVLAQEGRVGKRQDAVTVPTAPVCQDSRWRRASIFRTLIPLSSAYVHAFWKKHHQHMANH